MCSELLYKSNSLVVYIAQLVSKKEVVFTLGGLDTGLLILVLKHAEVIFKFKGA